MVTLLPRIFNWYKLDDIQNFKPVNYFPPIPYLKKKKQFHPIDLNSVFLRMNKQEYLKYIQENMPDNSYVEIKPIKNFRSPKQSFHFSFPNKSVLVQEISPKPPTSDTVSPRGFSRKRSGP